MRGWLLVSLAGMVSFSASDVWGQDPFPPVRTSTIPSTLPMQPHVEIKLDQLPTLPPVAPRMGLTPVFPPVIDPRTIWFDPYFYPTHYNFRPLPYGVPPMTSGFFYDTYANPYYNQYYGPGEYYGF